MRAWLILVAAAVAAASLTVNAQGPNVAEWQALMGQARVKRDARDFRAAADAFERAERILPLDHKTREEWYWVLVDIEPAKARLLADTLLSEDPGADSVRDRAIILAQAASDERSVARLAEAGARHNPKTALWPRRMGESRLRARQPASAVTWLRRAVAAADATETDRVLLAIALEGSGDATSALRIWDGLAPAVWQRNPEWVRSRLRTVVKAAPPARAIEALEEWVAAHPSDDAMQLRLADVLERANQPARALSVLDRVKGPASRHERLIREARLAEAVGDRRRTINARRSLLLESSTSEADRVALAHLLIDSGRTAEATTLATTLAGRARGCDDQSLTLLSRIDTPAADQALYQAIASYPKTCPSWALWTRRAVGELSGVQQFSAALNMLRPLATGALATDDDRETLGQLLFWTGQPLQAISVLAPLLQRQPGRQGGADALIDAYRSTNQSDRAWRIAKTRLSDPQLAPARRLSLAGLAIDRGALDEAAELAASARLADPSLANVAYAIEARALLNARKPVEALDRVGRIPADQLDEAGTLTWLEATHDVYGRRQALQAARGIEAHASEWPETLARTALWTAQEDGIDAAAALRTRVATLDATRADLLAIEIALATQKPVEAVRLADALLSHKTPTSIRERVLDLRIIALAALRLYGDARRELAGLMAMRPDEAALRVRDAVYQARALRASGDLAGALAVMPEPDILDTSDAVVRAELVQAVHGAPAAEPAWAALAERPDATDAVFLAWSRTAKSTAERQARLRAGQARFTSHANLDVALAESQIIDRDWSAAVQTAAAVLTRDPRIPAAWDVLVSGVAAQPRESVPATLSALPPQVFSQEPRTVYRLAERLASAGASDAAVEQALTWVRTVPPSSKAERVEAKLVEARILATRQRWQDALTALDSLPSVEQDRDVRRLRAQVLAWSGRHEEALVAYEEYLKTEPIDLMARREQARTAGWAQKIALSNQLYAQLVLDNPDSSAVRAEASAKRLMYAGQCLEAARAYRLWLEIEPDDTEARFDLGEVLTAAGRPVEARALYADLSAETPPHTLAAVANRRLARQSRPSGGAFSDRADSDGYNGQRLLERTDTGGRVILPLLGDVRQSFGFSAGTMTVSDGFSPQSGPAMRGTLALQPIDRLQARAAIGRAHPGSLSLWDAAVDLSVLAVDRLYVDAGFLRAPLWENLTTLRDGVVTTGPHAGVRFESPDTSLSLQISSASTGQNHRLVVGGSGSHRVRRGGNEIRLLADADRMSWSEPDVRYFSPRQFVRVNAGAEWQSWVHAPRFQADRKDALVLGYLFGVDSRGAAYHQPRARFAIELKEATIEAHAGWILSDVYTSTVFGFSVRVGG